MSAGEFSGLIPDSLELPFGKGLCVRASSMPRLAVEPQVLPSDHTDSSRGWKGPGSKGAPECDMHVCLTEDEDQATLVVPFGEKSGFMYLLFAAGFLERDNQHGCFKGMLAFQNSV